MGQTYDHIPEDHIDWATKQPIFWVATAPLAADGHINLSPKGALGTFHIIDKNKVWYEDLTGSGIETLSHLRENRRLTIMFHAFQGAPRILRLHGTGVAYEFGTPEYDALLPPDARLPGSRAAIVMDVHRVATSCGWGIPLYEYKGERPTLHNWSAKLERKENEGVSGLRSYWREANLASIDGLPGLQSAPKGDTPILHAQDVTIQAGMGMVGVEKLVGKARDQVRILLAFILGLMVTALYARFADEGRKRFADAFVRH